MIVLIVGAAGLIPALVQLLIFGLVVVLIWFATQKWAPDPFLIKIIGVILQLVFVLAALQAFGIYNVTG